MGMYDIVWVECPTCGVQVQFQSKAGDCCRKEFYISAHLLEFGKNKEPIPKQIAADLDGHFEKCEKCETIITIHTALCLHINGNPSS